MKDVEKRNPGIPLLSEVEVDTEVSSEIRFDQMIQQVEDEKRLGTDLPNEPPTTPQQIEKPKPKPVV